MIRLSAGEVAHLVHGTLDGCAPTAPVDGPVVTDSRLARPGALFVAVPGERTDGHDHAAAAREQGAVLSLVSRPVPGPHVLVTDTVVALGELARGVLARLRDGGGLHVVGVTGSVGKTTTKDLLAQVLAHAGPTVAPRASFNNEIGLPLTVLEATPTTRYLVLEMGASGPGHIDYLTRIAPLDVAVVLLVGHAHLEGFGTLDAVARAKAEILAGLREDGTAVLNADDARVTAMARHAPGPVTTFGLGAAAQLRAADVALDDEARARFTLHCSIGTQVRELPVHLAVRGEHQVHNALAVAAACHGLGLDLAAVTASLGAAGTLSDHRMALHRRPDGVVLLDDSYNANPDSVAAALRALAAMPARRRIAVLGDMLELGGSAVDEHRAAGRLAAELGTDVVLASGGYGGEVAAAAQASGSRGIAAADIEEAAARLDELLQEGDVVLLKGSNASGVWRLADRLAEQEEQA